MPSCELHPAAEWHILDRTLWRWVWIFCDYFGQQPSANKWQRRWTPRRISSSCFMRNVSLRIPQWAVSLCASGSVASVVRSTHAALSPFQSQYFVVIAADCFQCGDHINTGTCGYYVTPPPLHHTLPASVFVHPVISLFFPPSLLVDVPLPLFIVSVVFSVSSLPSICSAWIHLFFRLPSSPSIFVSPAAGNEYLIYSLSLLGDGLRE